MMLILGECDWSDLYAADVLMPDYSAALTSRNAGLCISVEPAGGPILDPAVSRLAPISASFPAA